MTEEDTFKALSRISFNELTDRVAAESNMTDIDDINRVIEKYNWTIEEFDQKIVQYYQGISNDRR